MKTSTYLHQVISYNFFVALHHLYMSLYIPIDHLKCWYFIATGKGNSGEYHLSVLVNSMKRRDNTGIFDDPEFLLFINASSLGELLKLDADRCKELQRLFVGLNSYMRFYLDQGFFLWRSRVATIKTGEDFFKAITLMGVVGRPELIEKIDPALFQTLRTADMKQMRSLFSEVLYAQTNASVTT